MTLTYNGAKPQSKNGELMFIWENGTFFSQLFTQMAGTWSAVESAPVRNPDFGPKIHFFQWKRPSEGMDT